MLALAMFCRCSPLSSELHTDMALKTCHQILTRNPQEMAAETLLWHISFGQSESPLGPWQIVIASCWVEPCLPDSGLDNLLESAGNCLPSVKSVGGLGHCKELRALDLSRNLIQGCPFKPLQNHHNLQLLSLLGNPHEVPPR